jgi:hypothetical protein
MMSENNTVRSLLLSVLLGRGKESGLVVLQQLQMIKARLASSMKIVLTAAISGSKGSSGLGLLSFS